MAEAELAAMKQKCLVTHQVWAEASAGTLQRLTEMDLPIKREARGALLNQLQVEHDAHNRYLAARQELFQFVQKHYRQP